LVFAASEVPVLTKGKGNKLINISSLKASSREEVLVGLQLLGPEDSLTVYAGKRHYTLKPADLAHYRGARARQGSRLPRGLQNVTSIQVGCDAKPTE
ncbi:MAG: hypothetical protein K2X39_02025, partial [Silvanigrellaceae bacterium]|nr:hypothetical protein [Silvanigrellaceae bacterium]